jgi:hypothetical protein
MHRCMGSRRFFPRPERVVLLQTRFHLRSSDLSQRPSGIEVGRKYTCSSEMSPTSRRLPSDRSAQDGNLQVRVIAIEHITRTLNSTPRWGSTTSRSGKRKIKGWWVGKIKKLLDGLARDRPWMYGPKIKAARTKKSER